LSIDADTPRSPGWWLLRLMRKLSDEFDRYHSLDSYYRGLNGIPSLTTKAEVESYRRLRAMACSNYPELIVESVVERMTPLGFRTGADEDDLGDSEAWRIWQANGLDADVDIAFRAALSMSKSYMIVGPTDPDIEAPLITVEDPREVTVETDPRRRRKVLAALKVFRDDVYGADRAFLFLPGVVYRAARPTRANDQLPTSVEGWEWDGRDALLTQTVPVVPFVNRPSMSGEGIGEFESHLPLIDRINYSVLQRLEIATMQAYRQRAVKGDLPTHDAQGNEVDYDNIFEAGPGALWQLPANVDIWESGQVDLGPIRQSVIDDERALAAVSGTPLYRFSPDAAAGSAEGASLQREGLVFKAAARIKQASESLEAVMSLAFLFAQDAERGSRRDMEVIWAPPDRVTMAEKYDAAVKAQAAGETWRSVMTDVLGKTPQQIERMEAERAADALLNAPLADAPEP
jgi:hypothetical protein